jgi:type I restriction enzyme S subunit
MNDLPEGFKMTELGALPEEWDVVRLGDVTEKTKQKDPRKTPEWKFKYVDVSSISRGALKIAECKLCQGKDAPSRAKRLVKNKDVIFATVRPTLKRLTLINEEFDGEICSTAFCVLRATENILNPLYLFYAVQRDVFIDEFEKVQRGASYPAITDSDVKNRKIPIPPLPEQHRIAAVLSAVQDAKEKTEAVIAAAKSLKKSLMRHLFTYGHVPAGEAESVPLKEIEIGLVPEGWLLDVIGNRTKLSSGGTPNRGTPEYWQNGTIPWVKTGEIDYRLIIDTEEKITKIGMDNSSAKLFPKGTLLIALYGQGITRGRVAILGMGAATNQACAAIFPSEEIIVEFLFYYLQYSYNKIREMSHGAQQKNLSAQIVKTFPVVIPGIDEQNQIIEILSSVDKKIEAEENKKKALDELFKSLLHNLMTGKIRVNHLEVTQ